MLGTRAKVLLVVAKKRWPLTLMFVGMILVSFIWLGLLTDPRPDYVLAILVIEGTLVGTVASGWNLYDAHTDWQALSRSRLRHDRVLTSIAESNYRREWLRLIGFVDLLILGGLALAGMSTPIIGRFLLMTLVVVMIVNALMDRLERESTAVIMREASGRDTRRPAK